MEESGQDNQVSAEALSKLKHDIKNQLSNINLGIEGLRYELENYNGEVNIYIEAMIVSARKIDQLLNSVGPKPL